MRNSLKEQLLNDATAFATSNPANEELGRALDAVLPDGAAMVVLEHTPGHIPELRDLAQDLLLDVGAAAGGGVETVIVRTPQVAIAVSDSLTRAQVEQGQHAMAAQPDYVVGVQEFFRAAEAFAVPWGAVAAAVLAGVVCAAVATWLAVNRPITDGQGK